MFVLKELVLNIWKIFSCSLYMFARLLATWLGIGIRTSLLGIELPIVGVAQLSAA